MADNDAILIQEIQPPYIGSAYSPQVEVTETTDGHNVAITYADGELGITTVDFDVLDGEQGPQGETGAAAGFGAVSASVDDEVGTPSVTVTSGGPDTAKTLDFAFKNLKGNKGDTGDAAGFGTVSATVDNATGTPSVEVTASGEDTAKNFAFAFHNLKGATGDPATPGSIGTTELADGAVTDVKLAEIGLDRIANNVIEDCNAIDFYLYKRDTAIDTSGNEVATAGYNLYLIPVEPLDILHFGWDGSESFAPALSWTYVFSFLLSDNTYAKPEAYGGGRVEYCIPPNDSTGMADIVAQSNYKAVMVVVEDGCESKITVQKNSPRPILNQEQGGYVRELNAGNTISSFYYINSTNKFAGFSTSGDYHAYFMRVFAGDRIDITGDMTGVSYRGVFRDASGTLTSLGNISTYTFPSNGIVCLFYNTTMTRGFTYYPADSVRIEGKNVIGSTFVQYDGMSGVAFGTSLTQRAATSNGYLTELASLSGITFDNQGIGSSYILGSMLTAIKSYTGYSGKRICLLEGFVNDWYSGNVLGTWKDTGETTVCGCVRSAINYMLSQNANMTVFLILDHYGQVHPSYPSIDCSTTATNGAGLTQFEYYEEIAKVAESLGVPVIKEYATSGISENTPQYLADNIHLNALGASQSAHAIWNQMKQYTANVEEGE